MTAFSDEVYAQIREGARRSSRIVAPMLVDEMRHARGVPRRGASPPFKVLDVGCGEGWWSNALLHLGHDVESLDQDVPEKTAPGVSVLRCELEESWRMTRAPYDLVLCLEVAEHLSAEGGDRLVGSLVRATNPHGLIAWSAAIPGQTGHGHQNEQWPDYWDARFRALGWMLSDPLRDRLWDDPSVEPWYAQNLLIATAGAANGTRWAAARSPRRLVHPSIWEHRLHDVAYWREEYLKADRRVAQLMEDA